MLGEDLIRMIEQYRFTVDLPLENRAFTLWAPELGVGESGASIKEARVPRRRRARVRAAVLGSLQRLAAHPRQGCPQELLAMLLESPPRVSA